MFQLIHALVVWKESLLAVCTAKAPSENEASYVQKEVCYNEHGCCAEDLLNLNEITPGTAEIQARTN